MFLFQQIGSVFQSNIASLREKVSGKKKRFNDGQYNLDLTYVCPRIIAMSFPAQGFEGLYRNPIDQVVDLIIKKHGLNFLVFNLSGRAYSYTKFNNQVLGFDWEDHSSPALHILFRICHQIHQFLSENPERVIVVHCLAGKGRTGTIICCYLLFCGRLNSVKQALDYYGRKRFYTEGLGVNNPCQIRYIQYFYRILTGERIYPSLKFIRSFNIDGKPNFNIDGGCKPYFIITNARTKEEIYNQKKNMNNIERFTNDSSHLIKLDTPIPLCGDMLIQFRNIGILKENKLMSLSINTSLLPDNSCELLFPKEELDPTKLFKDLRYPETFNLIVKFESSCQCTNVTSFDKKCEVCLQYVLKEKDTWEFIHDILELYKAPTLEESKIYLFGDPKLDDIEPVLNNLDEEWEVIKSNSFSFTLKQNLLIEQQQTIKNPNFEEAKTQEYMATFENQHLILQ